MIMLPSGKVVSDDEIEYEGRSPLMDKEEELGKEYATDEQVGFGLVA